MTRSRIRLLKIPIQFALLCALTTACDLRPPSPAADAAIADAVIADAVIADANLPDAAILDAAILDAAILDAAMHDAAVLDAAMHDAAVLDADLSDAAPDPARVAGPCASDLECSDQGICTSELASDGLYPDGLCRVPCARHADCGARGVCIRRDFAPSYCLDSCSPELPCREGWYCSPSEDSADFCIPDCLEAGCGDSAIVTCDHASRQCGLDPAYGRRDDLGRCTSGIQCGYGVGCCEHWAYDGTMTVCVGRHFPWRPQEGEVTTGTCDPDPWATDGCPPGLWCEGGQGGDCFCQSDWEHCFSSWPSPSSWCDPHGGFYSSPTEN